MAMGFLEDLDNGGEHKVWPATISEIEEWANENGYGGDDDKDD